MAWKVSKLDTEEISSQRSCAVEKTSKSYVNADVNPKSPEHNFNILYGSFNSSKIQSIGLVAYGKDFFAQVDLAEVELY